MTQHISEERNPQSHLCKNLRTPKVLDVTDVRIFTGRLCLRLQVNEGYYTVLIGERDLSWVRKCPTFIIYLSSFDFECSHSPGRTPRQANLSGVWQLVGWAHVRSWVMN
jgi:hypothetical protein